MHSYNISGLALASIFLKFWGLESLEKVLRKQIKRSENTVLLQTLCLQKLLKTTLN